MDKIYNILPNVIKKAGLQKKYLEYLIICHWQQIVGEDIRKHTQPKDIQRGVLFIIVDNPAWCHNLMMMKLSLINEINEYIGAKIILDIKLLNGSFSSDKILNIDKEKKLDFKKWDVLGVRLSQEEMNCIDDICQQTDDEILQEAIRKAFRAHIAVKKLKKINKWKKCKTCNALCMPEEEYCSVCLRKEKNKLHDEIKKVLIDTPWLNYEECNDIISCSEYQYHQARNELLSYFDREVEHNTDNSILTTSFVMLWTGLTPDKITEQIVRETIENRRKHSHVFALRRGQRNSIKACNSSDRFQGDKP